MKIAILGGSFNPVHLGHLQIADELTALGFDRIVFVPANIPAHKATANDDDPEIRLEMTRCGVVPYGYEVSDCEIRRGGVSYMIDTVAHMHESFPHSDTIGLVIGEDLLEGFHSWKDYRTLIGQVDLYLARRGVTRKVRTDIPYIRLDNPDFPVSSTEIRRRVREGKPYRFLVPPEVFQFITENRLYTGNAEEYSE